MQLCVYTLENSIGANYAMDPVTAQGIRKAIDEYRSLIEENNCEIDKLKEKVEQLHTVEAQTSYLFRDADDIYSVLTWAYNSMGNSWTGRGYHPATRARVDWRSLLTKASAVAETRIKGNEMKCEFLSHDPVNLSNGNFVFDQVDLAQAGDKPLFFARFYNSINFFEGSLGKDWNHNFEVHLQVEKNLITVMLENGREESFRPIVDGTYFCTHGSTDTLQKSEEGYILRTREMDIYTFDEEGILTGLNGKTRGSYRCIYEEDANKRLVRVEGTDGTFFTFTYDEKGYLSGLCDQAGRCVCFEVVDNHLKTVTDPLGNTRKYEYGDNEKITAMSDRTGTVTVRNTFDEKMRVSGQEFPDGTTMSFSYDKITDEVEQTERNGSVSRFLHDQKLRDIGHEDENGKQSFRYNHLNQKIEVKDPDGKSTGYSYDSRGNRTRITNALGVVMSLKYNRQNNLTGVEIAGKTKVRNSYDDHGNLIKTVDANGNIYQFVYDDNDRLIRTICPNGGILGFERDERGNIVCMHTPDEQTCTFTYDACNRVVARTDANGNITRIEYDANNNPVAVTRSDGAVRKYKYNANEQKTEVVDFDGRAIRMEYNGLNRISAYIDKQGRRTTFQYDKMWNLSRICYPDDTSVAWVYNSSNRLEKIIDQEGGITSFVYDRMGWITSKTTPGGLVTHFEHDDLGRVTKLYTDEEHARAFVYDEENRVTEIHMASGSTIRKKYDGNGNVTQITEPDGRVTDYKYNEMNLLLEMRRGDQVLIRYEYDSCSRPVRITDSQGRTKELVYDGNGNVIRSRSSLGFELEYTYDSMNRPICIKGSNGMSETITYDVQGNVLSKSDALGNTFLYTYTPSGKMETVTDPVGCVTVYNYDEMDRLVDRYQYDSKDSERVPHNRRRFAYDGKNRICEITDEQGHKESYRYDAEDHLSEVLLSDGRKIAYTYDSYGQMTGAKTEDVDLLHMSYGAGFLPEEVSHPDGKLSFGRDVMGRITDTGYPDGKHIRYEYGIDGKLAGITYSNGDTVTYEHDDKDRLTAMVYGEDAIRYRYHESGLLAEKEYPDQTIQRYMYDELARLTDMQIERAGRLVDQRNYTYDLQGNLSSAVLKTMAADGEIREELLEYVYDPLGRLTDVRADGISRRHYTFDVFGNRVNLKEGELETRYFYDSGNRLIRKESGRDSFDYQYDPKGNLTREFQNGDLIRELFYDVFGELREAVNHPANIRRTYSYDGLGFRTGIHTEKIDASLPMAEEFIGSDEREKNSQEEHFYLDYTRNHSNLLENCWKTESDGSYSDDTHHSLYLRDGKTAGVLHGEERGYYLHDVYNSVIGELSLDERNDPAFYTHGYDEYGVTEEGEFADGSFGFGGYTYDEAAGCWRSSYRMYRPKDGRFIAEDLIPGMQDQPYSLNLYTFCHNNPMTMVDPDGCMPLAAYIDEEIENLNQNVLLPAKEGIKNTAHFLGEPIRYVVGGVTEFGNEHPRIRDNVIGAVKKVLRPAFNFPGMYIGNICTRSPYSDEVFSMFGFDRSEDGQFHASLTCWQGEVGYGDFYDWVFKMATVAEAHKAAVTVGDESYCLWTWKGDYLNMGTGMEAGLYRASNPGGKTKVENISFWDTMRDQPTTMEMVMMDKNGRVLAYAPEKAHWWATAFNPDEYNFDEEALGSNTTVYAKLDLDGFDPGKRKAIFDAFKDASHMDASRHGRIHGMTLCFEEDSASGKYTIYYTY